MFSSWNSSLRCIYCPILLCCASELGFFILSVSLWLCFSNILLATFAVFYVPQNRVDAFVHCKFITHFSLGLARMTPTTYLWVKASQRSSQRCIESRRLAIQCKTREKKRSFNTREIHNYFSTFYLLFRNTVQIECFWINASHISMKHCFVRNFQMGSEKQ